MKVTEIKVFPVREEKLKAFVSIVIDHCFMVNDIKVIKGKEDLFISMPSRRKKNGKIKDVAHPLNNETRQMLEGLILDEYRRAIGELTTPRPQLDPEPAAPEEEAREVTEGAAPAAKESPAPAEPVQEEEDSSGEKSLEEVAELHLRDSFWNT